jgi:predicted enzyme related to lactoylglutathione lyase
MTNMTTTNICASDLLLSKRFYTRLFEVKVAHESDWYIEFNGKGNPALEFAVITRDHDLVPEEHRVAPCGIHVKFTVDDVDALYNRAVSTGVKIVQAPRNEVYGQRRFLVKDPDGCLIDISSPIKPH